MAIEISDSRRASQATKTLPKAAIESEKKVAITTTEKNDSIALTSATQEMKKPVGSSSAAPVNIDKVNSVKKALADGSYEIKADQIAKKLMQFEKLISQEN